MKDRLINKNPIRRHDILEIYTDGASRGNPGPAAWAYIFVRDGEIIYQNSEYIGEATKYCGIYCNNKSNSRSAKIHTLDN